MKRRGGGDHGDPNITSYVCLAVSQPPHCAECLGRYITSYLLTHMVIYTRAFSGLEKLQMDGLW
jgi:hypothetical protein